MHLLYNKTGQNVILADLKKRVAAFVIDIFLLFTIFQFNNRKRQVGIARILVIAQFAFVIYLLSSLQQQITTKVLEVDKQRKRIQLALIK